MEEQILDFMTVLENTYLNRSGKVQECFSVGHWLIQVSKLGLEQAFAEFETSAMEYIEGDGGK